MTSNRYFTQLTATVSTYFDTNGGLQVRQSGKCRYRSIAYYDGQFKTGIPEGPLTFAFSL